MVIGPINRIDLMAVPAESALNNEPPAVARELVKAVKELNRSEFSASERELTFRWDSTAGRPVICIVNRESGELIEEIPPETFRRMMDDLTKTK